MQNSYKRLRSSFPEFDVLVDVIAETKVQNSVSGGIVTHNGPFHCDEALACGLLKVVPEFRDMEVCRTRDKTLINQGAVVVDVGGEFDASKNRFDHHQNSFAEDFYGGTNPDHKIKLSSAGLVFKYHGMTVLRQLLPTVHESSLDVLFFKMYNGFVEEIDGLDNGVAQCEGVPNYRISTGLTDRVGNLRVSQTESHHMSIADQELTMNARFKEAMELTMTEFCQKLHYLATEWLPARLVVESALCKAEKGVHASGEIIVLDCSVPWKSHLLELERDMGVFGRTKYCLFVDRDQWRVQAVPSEDNGFDSRVPLKWKGLTDEALCEASGIPGCVFVHGSGFIGGNKTYEGALAMAVASLGQQLPLGQ